MATKTTYEIDFKGNDGVSEVTSGIVSAVRNMQSKLSASVGSNVKELAAQGAAASAMAERHAQAFSTIESDATRSMGSTASAYAQCAGSTQSVRAQLTSLRNEMSRMRLAGKENTEEYERLRSEMERLGVVYRELQTEQNALSTGATQWGGVISGLQGLMGVYSAGSGVVSLFTKDNEKLMEVQAKMQSVMAIMMGMQQAANTLHATSAFRIVTVRRVTELWRGAQIRLTAALAGSTVAAKALMAAITMGASVIIGEVISAISRLVDKHREQKEAQREAQKAQEDAMQSARSTVASSISAQLLEFRKLQNAWTALGSNISRQKRFLQEAKSSFEKLGVSITSVRDAENLLVNNSDTFVQALRRRAMAAAGMELASQKYKSAIDKMLKAEESRKVTDEDKRQATDYASNAYQQRVAGASSTLERGQVSLQEKQIKQDAYSQNIHSYGEARAKAYNQEAQREIEEGDKYLKLVEQHNKEARDLLTDGGISEADATSSTRDAVAAKVGSIAAIEKKLQELRTALNNASADERTSLQEDINVWQQKLDVIHNELDALSVPAHPATLAELDKAISVQEQALKRATAEQRAGIQQTINDYKAQRSAIEDTLSVLNLPQNPHTLNELNDAISYYRAQLGKAAPEQRAMLQEIINDFQAQVDTIEKELADLLVPTNPQTLEEIEQVLSSLEAKLQQAGDTEREEIQKSIKAYRLKKATIEELLEQSGFDVNTDTEIVVTLRARVENATYAERKIKELQELAAVAQTDEERKAINDAIKQWNRYAKSLNKTAKNGDLVCGAMSNVGSIMSSMSGVVNDNAAGWLSYGANILSTVSQMMPLLASVIGGNIAAAFSGAAAQSQTQPYPFNIIALAASMAAVTAAVASIPKYADGGIAYGPTVGLFGEYAGAQNNPEVVAPLDKLRSLIEPAGGTGEVTFRIEGRTLVGLLNKTQRVINRTK
jgi:hypothetical protein